MTFQIPQKSGIRFTAILWIILVVSTSAALAEEPTTHSRKIIFPKGDIFLPLMADPKQPQFAASALNIYPEKELSDPFIGGFVVYGETFGLVRMQDASGKDKWQISIKGGLFAQFNLEGESMPLLNADYLIGLAYTSRWNAFSLRSMFYHQSTHLGDELLLQDEQLRDGRINFSYEALDIIGAYEWRMFRFYSGGLYAVRTDPSDLKKFGFHSGMEYYGTRSVLFSGKLVGGMDIKIHQEQGWNPNANVKFGIQYGKTGSGNRYVRLMAEIYDGYIPFGQFFDDKMRSYGIGFALGF